MMRRIVDRSYAVAASVAAVLCLAQAARGVDLNAPDRWWKLDEGTGTTVTDSSGNAVNGTMMNMAASAWVDGVDGKALSFDGTDDYIVIPDNALPTAQYYELEGGVFTVAFWVKAFSDEQMSLICRSTPDSTWWNSAKAVRTRKPPDGTGPMKFETFLWDGTNEVVTGTTTVQLDTWYYVTMVNNLGGGLGAFRLFVNGSLEGSERNGLWWPRQLVHRHREERSC
jgi:hypothetical protein